MSTMTMKHDQKLKTRRQAAQASAEREQARAELVATVKADAMKLAAGNSAFKSRWRIEDITGMDYEEMTVNQKIEVLEDIIDTYRELGTRLLKEYGDKVERVDELEKRIEVATDEIVKLSINEIDQVFIDADPDRPEEQPATNYPGTSR